MHRVCIFAASRNGALPAYGEAARSVGSELARRGFGMVYGGASVGLMGAAADAALAGGAEVQGVIPRDMVDRELAHAGLTHLWIVETMHERKARMYDLSDAFLVLPGGSGTLDETFETITWMQLGLHRKPIGLLDVEGYWQPLVTWLRRAVDDGFVPAEHARDVRVDADPLRLLDALGPALSPRGT